MNRSEHDSELSVTTEMSHNSQSLWTVRSFLKYVGKLIANMLFARFCCGMHDVRECPGLTCPAENEWGRFAACMSMLTLS